MNIRPIGDRVLVQREASDEKTSGGILLPDAAKKKPQRGTVLAIGTGKMLKSGDVKPLQVKVGDKILFTTWAGDEYKSGKDEVLLMREEEILAVID